ncbi:ATP-dependent chaperone ClpB [Nostoc sphaeroides CCNUC1]|uniref:ATP-dependent chaperone ClpB n=1 Tax=Nostoc sphaeroides CCNUC1 TaxID=2653204 RepID=A0A5P8W6E1_9NOSO|nr:AAA family ATPase [Nostoc sphaeroides]QFS48220.1 ATP-dependent chaperone ClpB [Nostoc sphaeroides CCNUC1]
MTKLYNKNSEIDQRRLLRLLESERQKLLQLESHLHQRVIGQEEAVEAVAAAIRRDRAGMKDPSRPIGSFLFIVPTGVGKTELARALAQYSSVKDLWY